jgi:glycosyltransferase involved in cell wall biosynthesis
VTGSRVRVLSIIGSLNIGGTETYVSRIAPEIRRHDIDMEILALDPAGPRKAELEAAGVVIHGTPYPERVHRSDTLTLLRTVERIARVVRDGRYDAVQTFLYWADVLGVPAARLGGCRRVIISRRAMHPSVHSSGGFFHALEQAADALASEVIANSRAVLRDAEAHERMLPRRRTVIYNGVDVDRYRPAEHADAGPLRLLTIGALTPHKGQAIVIDALRLIVAAGVPATLTVVGAGPDDASLRRQAAGAGLASAIEFTGEVADPRTRLSQADAFVLASRDEGFSNAILEAMASALPVIATDAGGNAEAVAEGEGGFLVEAGSTQAQAMADRMQTLAANRALLRQMGQFNRQRAAAMFSLESSARCLADWYRSSPA